MNFFLGIKDKIGVEVKVTDLNNSGGVMGYSRLWFGGNYFGNIKDYIYLDGYLLGGLFQMLNVPIINDNEFPSEKKKQFSYFNRRIKDINDDEVNSYQISFGTFSDNFSTWVYRLDDCISIIWKINKKAESPLLKDFINYPPRVFGYTLLYNDFEEFVKRLDRVIKNW